MRIILADPHTLFRAALKHLLTSFGNVQVVAEAGDGRHALDLAASYGPDLLLSEFSLDGITGPELIHELRRRSPRSGIIFISACHDDVHVRAALKAGAVAYISKSGDASELDAALRAFRNGTPYVSKMLAHNLVEKRRHERSERSAVLTPRQRDVLRLVAVGKSTREIALQLGLSPKTVETHRARLMQALGLRGINALMHFAVRFCSPANGDPQAARSAGGGMRESGFLSGSVAGRAA